MIRIPLTQGKFALVDDDMGHLLEWKWQLSSHGYAVRNAWIPEDKRSMTCFMHHCVTGKPLADVDVDHIDNNQLNNTRANLRVVSHRVNSLNRAGRFDGKYTSLFPGIYFHSGNKRWIPRLKVGDKRIQLGSFKDQIDAFCAYIKARRHYGV